MGHKKSLKRNLLIALLAGSAALYTMPIYAATSVIANNALPKFDKVIAGELDGGKPPSTSADNLTMNVVQSTQNAVIKWNEFNVGGSATVNFDYTGKENFNTLNYVNSGAASQIYGTINAQYDGYAGNIFVVNPAGVQIGNSAQINVGSLYVSNKYLNEDALGDFAGQITPKMINTTMTADAELMSLGNINANKVTFEGDGRIVIDSERIKDGNGDNKLSADKIFVNTANENNVIIGYDAYDETLGNDGKAIGYAGANTVTEEIATVNDKKFTKANGYMWVEDVDQLQAINTNLKGNYALRNSIDATSTAEGAGFTSIGLNENNEIQNEGKGFTGSFDGIEYNIFGLNITGNDNAGLFGYTDGATINNVTLVGGSISGGTNVGAVVGSANNTTISNVVNSAAVTGNTDVGGIVGSATNSSFTNLINTGAVTSNGTSDNNGGSVSNAGGLIGYMNSSQLIGNSYNLGNVEGKGYNVGGLVGHAVNSIIGDGTNLVYNRLDVTGAYNVGGIVGNMEGSTVQNAENSATVTATGFDEGTYTYHSAQYKNGNSDGERTENVNVANVGGIAGTSSSYDNKNSIIENVTNTGDVSSNSAEFTDNTIYYTAGNVGGIVGSAVDTNITNATNQENDVRGAHNVGGVAGYFGGSGTVTNGINDGGDIMATGARNGNGFVYETVRPIGNSNETFIIGNIGGIVGYMDGDNVKVTGSANRGTVHSYDIDKEHATNVLDISKAANVGGVVGKIDTSGNNGDTLLEEFRNGTYTNASVSNSYNTGDVRGYTGVGGVVGMMYNGEVAGSYNLGYIRTTRIATNSSNIDAVNMGGVVGDTTEGTNANALIYDVYNKGQIGDDTYTYYARHVAGIVGRLSGTVEKAYNNGEIYNGYTATGGIAGWMYKGSINNAFNTGNITVYNHDTSTSQVGGIVGAASVDSGKISLSNIYNLGTIRSFKANQNYSGSGITHSTGNNAVGGIIGAVMGSKNDLFIDSAYTTGNIYAGNQESNGSIGLNTNNNDIGSIYGELRSINDSDVRLTNVYYIRPQSGLGFTTLGTNGYGRDNSNKAIDYADRSNSNSYSYYGHNLTFTSQTGGAVTGDGDWRIYGDTPILNAFLPNSEQYFDQYDTTEKLNDAGMASVQYGTAYDPLLTIINANGTKDLEFNFGTGPDELSITNAAGLVVYNAGLTLNNFDTNSGAGYFGGTIYADGVLNLNSKDGNNIGFGSASQIYGSSVNIEADGTVTIYGDVTATGNGTSAGDTLDEAGSIKITSTGGDVDIYGTLTSAKDGQSVTIPGIAGTADPNWSPVETGNRINDPSAELNTIGDRFAYTTESSNVNGNIIISAGATDDDGKVTATGNVNLYYGNKENGITTTGGNLTVEATGDVYVDSDLDIGGNLSLTGTGENSEVVLDLTNIGQVQAENGISNGLDKFLTHFANTGDNSINFGETADAKITVDMWENNELNLEKFGSDFTGKLNALDLNGKTAKDITHIWVNNAEQLNNIQKADDKALGYNFALKNDINASDLTDYVAIGTGNENGFTGTFDGRGNRIIGLTVNNDSGNAGIFDKIGATDEATGVVKNLNIYSGNFTGTTNAGAVAGENNGRIENITAFGNTVTASGNAGGIVGVNNGSSNFENSGEGASTLTGNGIYDVESTGSVIAGSNTAIAGGLVGTNKGALGNSFSNSAVTVETGIKLDNTADIGLGGVVGVNTGEVQYVDSLGVTNGGDTGSSNIGGVIGINNGTLHSAYNESIVSGSDNVGGIIGENVGSYDENNKQWTGGVVSNIVNATSVTGIDDNNIEDEDDTAKNGISDYVGGLVGSNSGSVTNGRNNGTITGTNYVGGMVGDNASGAELTDLVNDSSASITGVEYVGGIAGSNAGTITADEENDNLINRGSITGHTYVGGVAGVNTSTGIIANTNNSVVLNANEDVKGTAEYFGGVVGQNSGLINGATNTSDIDITAVGGSYVGGIIGQNTSTGKLEGEILNQGSVAGKSDVGGIIGENSNDKVLQGTENDRLIVTNEGDVTAEDGGAAGIFYENTGNISYADITNTGNVIGGSETNSVTGGLFGKNSGNITNSTLTNTGIVTGGGTVGGLIGSNSGDISTSSLINEAGATVIGINNVGGLIGVNTGTIEGGRDEADSYYKYQIYNNGVINVGTWTDENNDGIVDAGEIKGISEGVTSENIGGLIGNNAVDNSDPNNVKTGSLTAGYNTGAINAGDSTNVGGIAGSNSGTIDQVFNTVMVEQGSTQQAAITGGTNVGGLVGNNATDGELSNAYNTTDVIGTTNVGNAVGENSGKISSVFDVTNEGNTLVGTGSGTVTGSYTSAATEENADGTNGITYISSEEKNNKGSYTSLTNENTWKFYDGNQTPLLSVFLTDVNIKVDVDKINEYINNVYNGNAQSITYDDIDKLIAEGAITAPDNFTAYQNAKELIESISHTNAGGYSDWLYSGQIAQGSQDGSFNPNNLGYDIALTANIDKAKLIINLGEVTHVYGTPTTNGYTYTVEGWVNAADADDYTIDIGTLGNGITDNALKDNNIHTNNVDEYTWTTKATITANGDLNNYEIVTVNNGKSIVTPVTVVVTLNDVTHIYGDEFNSNKYTVDSVGWVNGDSYTNADIVISGVKDNAFTEDGKTKDVTTTGYTWTANANGSGANAETIDKNYIFNVSEGKSKVTPKQLTVDDILASIQYGSKGEFTVENTGKLEGVVYDDEIGLTYTGTSIVKESEYAANQNGRDTADVKANNGVYADSISLNGIKLTGEKAGNYYIADTATGDIRVDKATITIDANSEEIHLGETPNYTGTDINDALVNGDVVKDDYSYGLIPDSDVDINVADVYEKVIGGIFINGTFYDLSGETDWSKVTGWQFLSNYNITFNPGTLTVTDQVLPDLPDNWPSNRWDYLFSDNPFDRNRNFRERKAEVNFVDGGMEI
ncbi:MAG: hypothetical protein DBY32_01660 [Phascolarctobacterium sp.]|nr:MAG: hypothetical protein DBY32_01660 [Phascolarctobacterium sp.]